MTTTKAILAVLAIAALLGAGVACANTAPADQAPAPAPSALVQTSSTSSSSSDSGGIWVTGRASVSVEPDLVLLNVGVESEATTVAVARAEAAKSMAAVIKAVKAHDIEDKDIQTQSFNIWPQYDWGNDRRTLVGYTVSNTATIKIRAIDDAGPIIDDVAKAGGDATRIDGIRFTVEDPSPYMTQLREGAVRGRGREGRALRGPDERGGRRRAVRQRRGDADTRAARLRRVRRTGPAYPTPR